MTTTLTSASTNTSNVTAALNPAKARHALASVIFVASLGLALLVAAGHAQSAALHDAAHDVRHATGFPCH